MIINTFWTAVLLTTFAGLSTGIGSLLVFLTKKTNDKFLSVSLGFSAGVMIYISFVELFKEGNSFLINTLGSYGAWFSILSFFAGFAIVALIDKFIPEHENPHEMHNIEEVNDKHQKETFTKLHKVGVLMAIAISIHNFPEGLVTFLSTITNVNLGIAIALAVAIHNIPEGIAVAIPIYYATGSKKKAIIYSFLSGFAEPLGGIIGFIVLRPFMSDTLMGIVFSLIAGIMVFISLDSLLPSAEKYGHHHLSISGVVLGMIVMAISLVLLS